MDPRRPLVLLYDPEETGVFRLAHPMLAVSRVRVRMISPDQVHRTVGELAGVDVPRPAGAQKTGPDGAQPSGGAEDADRDGSAVPADSGAEQGAGPAEGAEEAETAADAPAEPNALVMLFCFFDKRTFDKVLRDLRRADLPRDVYKAVLTQTNAAWPFIDLVRELERERRAIDERNKNL
ncbi:MAG: DUF3783 domain-containing protein [Lachnospiraceae bacterium]|nr:DUF3783 domain-containing protein [Lachnospiraceae bacterium]